MRILITGGNGFIARHLKTHFEKFNLNDVYAPTRNELDLDNFMDVENYFKNRSFDVVIHTATYDAAPKHTTKDKTLVLEKNLRMFFNIERHRSRYGKLINLGSGAEYTRSKWKPMMEEAYFDNSVPPDQYGYSKYLISKYIEKTSRIYNLRLFSVYGPYEDYRVRYASNACCRAIYNVPIQIHQNRWFDFLYIDDLCQIVDWFCFNTPKHKVYNICSGEPHSFEKVAEILLNLSGSTASYNIGSDELGLEYSGNNKLLLEELEKYHKFNFTSLERGLKSLYLYYLKNLSSVKKELL